MFRQSVDVITIAAAPNDTPPPYNPGVVARYVFVTRCAVSSVVVIVICLSTYTYCGFNVLRVCQ